MLGFLLAMLYWAPARSDVTGPARIVDGDTLVIEGETIRLHGIDAPEIHQTCRRGEADYLCGVMATAWLIERTLGAEVTCAGDRRDRYGRLLAVCRVEDMDLNEGIILDGWAVAFRRYSRVYSSEEVRAQNSRFGMWAGTFERPVDWRRAKRNRLVVGVASTNCAVKGNVNARGQRIYHRPGGQHYESLRLKPLEGDRCFNSEQQARDAGFRAAAR